MKTFISIALIAFFISLNSCHYSGGIVQVKNDTTKTLVQIVVDSLTGQLVVRSAYRIDTVRKSIDASDNVTYIKDTLYFVQWPIPLIDSTGKVMKDLAGNARKVYMFTPVDKKFILHDFNKSFF